MKLFKRLRKQFEKLLPYRIIDVTPDELLTYVGKGKDPVLCKQKDKQRIIGHLLTAQRAFLEWDSDVMRRNNMVIIWDNLIGGWPTAWCMFEKEYSVWLRVVNPSYTGVDDLI